MHEIVEYLCSPACLPRNPGTDGGVAAGIYLRDHLDRLGLTPVGEYGFDQAIPSIDGANLLGSIPGSGNRYVMLAAHYDACGIDNPGADDNAAAVAIALHVAEALQGIALDRSVIIALFDAEEPPFFLGPAMGSQWFVDHPTVPLDRVDTMVCLDLVGHSLGPDGTPDEVSDSVFILGAEKSTGTGALFEGLPDVAGIRPRRMDNYIIGSMSDYDAFMNVGIPFLFYTAGRSEHYHAPTDTPDRLDYSKMAALATHLTDLMAALANRTDTPSYLPDGYDDEATLSSIAGVLAPLAAISTEAAMAGALVAGLRANLDANGHLSTADRSTIAMLIAQVENALS